MYFWQDLIKFSDKIALVDSLSGKSLTYFNLNEEAKKIAKKLQADEKGLIFLFTSNNAESVITYIAALQSGKAILLLDEKLNEEIRSGLIETYRPEFIVTSDDHSPVGYFEEIKYESLAFYKRELKIQSKIHSELAVLLSTSGTTGSPKLVRLAYKNIQANAESIAQYLEINSDEKPITTLPMNYSYGLSVINSHLLKGSTIILTEKTVFFRDFWDLFNFYNCTSFAGVPYTYTMLKRINFDKIELPTLKYFTQAGGKLSEEFIRFFSDYAQQKHVNFFVMYGQTEATARISYVPADKLSEKIGSIGISIPGGELKIMNDKTEITKPNEVGEIVYKGDNVMFGYAESRNDLSKNDELNGMLFTGDLGYKDADGFIENVFNCP